LLPDEAPGFQSCLALQVHELGGLHGQLGKVAAKRFGDHFLGLVQVFAGVHQVASGLHGLGPTYGGQNGGHGIGVRQDVFAGVQSGGRQQRLGECPGPRGGLGRGFKTTGGGCHDQCGAIFWVGYRSHGGVGYVRRLHAPLVPHKKSATART
jgi:hypothetical protein